MPEFYVTVVRDTREKAEIKIEAANETKAKAAAVELVENGDDEDAGIVWHYKDTTAVRALDAEAVKSTAA